ncbi:MAG: Stp1/IreP family PP2C-type Ser/Thr phosphatase [Proteobacteria bacterium]|nr:Stp1/IreP family PP2C-type Ser/Thr phosphatase [Pseudomonadota bacterium]MBU1737372.1 Stp1/IreP family PP2C-type Ser/Thr phosphatase [Pseudomonadota bacterium]
MNFKVCGLTDVGMKRTKNEDNYGIDKKLGLFLVADGMGGHAAGEVASKMAIDLITDYIRRTMTTDEPYLTGYNSRYSRAGNRLNSAIILANQVISDTATSREEWQGMGTTIVAAWRSDPESPRVTIAHVGDSRAYLLRSGNLQQITTDHSLVEEQIRDGLITADEAKRSRIRNMITRALGYRTRVEVDINEFELESGDKLLICSDGLNGMLGDEDILDILQTNSNLEETCRQLIHEANQMGGRDNITTVLASFL